MKDPAAYFIYLLVRTVTGALCLLPLRMCFALGWMFGFLAWVVMISPRRLALRNMQIAFGREKSDRELRGLVAAHFRSLGANLLAGIKLASMSEEAVLDVVNVKPFVKEMKELVASGRGVVMVLAHLGNWEAMAQIFGGLQWTRAATLYQKLGNPYIDAHVRRMRERQGVKLIERKQGLNEPVRYLRDGGLLGVLIDQHAGDAGVWVPLFGRLASTSPLAAMLAARTKAALLSVAVVPDGFARWKLQAQPVQEVGELDVVGLTARLNEILETQIRQFPADWFWVHNRWRTPNPDFLLSRVKRGFHTGGVELQPFKILIRSSNWLGDCVMTLPAVRAIKQGRPDAQVSVLTSAKLGDFWRRVPWVDEVVLIEPGEGVLKVGKKIRAPGFDVGVLFPNSLRTALEMKFAGVPRIVGYAGHSRRWLLDQIIPVDLEPGPPVHQVMHYLRIAKICGGDTSDQSVEIGRRELPNNEDPVEIGLCPGAEYGSAKRWIPERFAEAAKQVIQRRAVKWVIFGTAKERALSEDIAACLGEGCENLAGETTLEQLMDRLARCRVLLTNDTGTMHLATMLGVPVVAIFGSTEPVLTGPLGDGHHVIRHQVECSPCFLRECPIDFRCMKSVEVDEVVESVVRHLDRAMEAAVPTSGGSASRSDPDSR